MRRLFFASLVIFLISSVGLSQGRSYSEILRRGIEAKLVLDSLGYLPDGLKDAVFRVLKSNAFDLSKCFCDKKISYDKTDDSLTILIWDEDDLTYRKRSESAGKVVRYESTHKGFLFGNNQVRHQDKVGRILRGPVKAA
jgi:hypothetical protein